MAAYISVHASLVCDSPQKHHRVHRKPPQTTVSAFLFPSQCASTRCCWYNWWCVQLGGFWLSKTTLARSSIASQNHLQFEWDMDIHNMWQGQCCKSMDHGWFAIGGKTHHLNNSRECWRSICSQHQRGLHGGCLQNRGCQTSWWSGKCYGWENINK